MAVLHNSQFACFNFQTPFNIQLFKFRVSSWQLKETRIEAVQGIILRLDLRVFVNKKPSEAQ